MSYQKEREQFIAAVTREGLDYWRAEALLRCATTINRLAELACSSEAADRDRIACPAGRRFAKKGDPCLCDYDHAADQHTDIPRIRLQDYRAELRANSAIPAGWSITTSGDPRSYTLRVIPPSYAERNKGRDVHNLDSIGVPPGPSGLRF